jgi:hypothetical protein
MEKTRFYPGEKGKAPVLDYNEVQPGESHEVKSAQLEFWIAKQIGTDLASTYRNRQWHVDVDARNNVIIISAPSLSKVFGYHLHIRTGETMPQLLLRTRKAGGEILERYNVTRARNTDPLIIEEGLTRDRRDNVISADAIPDRKIKNG